MTGVLIRRGDLDTHTQRCKTMEATGRRRPSASQGQIPHRGKKKKKKKKKKTLPKP